MIATIQISRDKPTLWWPGRPERTAQWPLTSHQYPLCFPRQTWPAPAWSTSSPRAPVLFAADHYQLSATICLISPGPAPPSPALTVCSWAGLDCSIDNKERTLYFETFLRWVGAFRSLNNLKLRILIGGLFNVDLKVIQVGNIYKYLQMFPNIPSSGSSPTLLPCCTPTDQTPTRGGS